MSVRVVPGEGEDREIEITADVVVRKRVGGQRTPGRPKPKATAKPPVRFRLGWPFKHETPANQPARRHGPRVATTVAVVVAVLLLGQFLRRAYHQAYRPGGCDVHCFLVTANALRAGTNPYQVAMPIPFNYPLFASVASVPLTFLPEWLIHGSWFFASLAAWAAAAFLVVRELAPALDVPVDRQLIVPVAWASLLLLGPIQNHLLNGQTDAFVLLLCVLFWTDWHQKRLRRSAIWLGTGMALKLVPGLFLVPLAIRRSRSLLLQSSAWFLLLTLAFPVFFLGLSLFTAYRQYFTDVLLAELRTSAHSLHYPHCYTLQGAVAWLWPGWGTAPAARAGALLAVLLPLYFVEKRCADAAATRRFARFEAYLAGILLLAPLSQPHHLTLLLPFAWSLVLRWVANPGKSLRPLFFEMLPFGLFPLWKICGGPLEMLAVAWLFASALYRAAGLGESTKDVVLPLPLNAPDLMLRGGATQFPIGQWFPV